MTAVAAGAVSVPFALAAAAVGIAWWVLLAVLVLVRRAPRIDPSRAHDARATVPGLDLPPEPPAVAGLLANGFVVTAESAPAVLLDLAARDLVDLDEVQPGRTICRLRDRGSEEVTDYERVVLDELRRKAVDGVVPTEALTTGPEDQSRSWHRGLARAITDDARRRGLTVPRWPAPVIWLLGVGLAVVGALLAVAIWAGDDAAPVTARAGAALAAAATAVAVGVVTTARLRTSLAQLPTDAGMRAASRAVVLAADLRENDVLAELPPAGVHLWDRLFAYAAVFGAAPAAVALLPMGAEDDRRAWSSAGGRWRRVTVSYPRAWPPAWGKHPFLALSVATFWGVLAGVVLYGLRELAGADRPGGIPPRVWDWAGRGAIVALVPVVAVLAWAVWIIVRAIPDLRQSAVRSGVIVRERRKRQWFSWGDDPDFWYYLAVDDGSSPQVRALRVRASLWQERAQGETVTAVVSPRLGFVRSMTVA